MATYPHRTHLRRCRRRPHRLRRVDTRTPTRAGSSCCATATPSTPAATTTSRSGSASPGLVTYALDHRGHGRSGGKRVYLRDISEYTDDFHTLVGIAAADHPDSKRVVLGHSMGGGIVFAYGVEHPDDYAAMVLSGPAVDAQDAVSPVMVVRRQAARQDRCPACPSNSCPPTRCPATPRWSPPTTPTRWSTTASCPRASPGRCIGVGETMPQRAGALTAPLLVVHGEQDKLIPVAGQQAPDGVRRAPLTCTSRSTRSSTTRCSTSPNARVVLDDVASWIEARALKRHCRSCRFAAAGAGRLLVG